MNKHVVSLEVAKRLKEVGYPQEGSLFYYDTALTHSLKYDVDGRYSKLAHENHPEIIAAPTAGELGERLPKSIQMPNITKDNRIYMLTIDTYYGDWSINYRTSGSDNCIYKIDKTEADARGKCLIYLLENKLVKGVELCLKP